MAQFETDALVEPVGGFTRRARGQIDSFGAQFSGAFERAAGKGLARAFAGL